MTATLVGDGIEQPANARALMDAAAMFGTSCRFRDSRGLAGRWLPDLGGGPLPTVDTPDLMSGPLVAVDNMPDAESVFTAAPPAGQSSIVVGNERRGIRPDVVRAAARRVVIPMAGTGVDTLNVAAAAAVALYFLRGHGGRRGRASQRPDVLLLGPGDHVEAGSVLRSAAAFGWGTVAVDDRHKVWFGTPRPVRAEGRAAARSHRSALRVVPVSGDPVHPRVVVAGTRVDGPPLHRVDLGRPDTLLVLPDEEAGGWDGAGPVTYARIDVPAADAAYRYRLAASIALAEAARQLGRHAAPTRPKPTRGAYHSWLTLDEPSDVDIVPAAELYAY